MLCFSLCPPGQGVARGFPRLSQVEVRCDSDVLLLYFWPAHCPDYTMERAHKLHSMNIALSFVSTHICCREKKLQPVWRISPDTLGLPQLSMKDHFIPGRR